VNQFQRYNAACSHEQDDLNHGAIPHRSWLRIDLHLRDTTLRAASTFASRPNIGNHQ
jgi:hypothetical protein